MASPTSSADEGEIVERQDARHDFKAKTTATVAAAAHADDDVDSFNVDRRNRNYRDRSPRSPRSPRLRGGSASLSSYPYRSTSPRGLKRQRDDRDASKGVGGGSSRWGGDRGDWSEGYDDRSRDYRRRGGLRDDLYHRTGNDRRRDRDRDRDHELRYDDHDDRDRPSSSHRRNRGDFRYDDSNTNSDSGFSRTGPGKRQRTRSRSPPPSAAFRGNGNRERNERDRRDRDRDFDRNRDRDYYRDDRRDRLDRPRSRERQVESNSQSSNGQHASRKSGSAAKSAEGASLGRLGETRSDHVEEEPSRPPPPQEDWVETEPVDEEAEIRRRRQRREEILRKSRASTPMLALSLQADKTAASAVIESKTQEHTPVTGNNTPRSCKLLAALPTPADHLRKTQHANQRMALAFGAVDAVTTADSPMSTSATAQDQAAVEAIDLGDDQDFMNALGKQNTGRGSSAMNGTANGNANDEDGPSAADYDPTVDMEEDERRDEMRHGGMVPGLHGAERRESLTTAANNDVTVPPNNEPQEAAADGAGGAGGDDDDEDDMFAENFVEKKYEAPKKDAAPADAAGAVGGLPTAANGGGILEGDDQQGYYKIRPGEVVDGRYQIQSTLGKGMFSGVARAWDITSTNKRLVAIKIMRNNDALRKGGYTEIAILQKLNGADPDNRKHIVRFERSFDYRGHLCMVFENLSMNLREVLKKFGNNVGISLHGVRVYAYQIFVSLAHMRRCSIIHADLKPDNILVNDNRSTLKICDLGTAIDRSDAATAHMEITPYLVSRFYRAPEIILGMPYDYAIDMWSIGCTLYELYTGKILFTGESNNQMLRAIMEIRGKISAKLYRRGELWPMHFDEKGGFLSQEHDKFQGKTTIKTLPMLKPIRDLRTRLMAASYGMTDIETRDLNQFYDLLDKCLNLNPDKRILPSDALKHPFFTARSAR